MAGQYSTRDLAVLACMHAHTKEHPAVTAVMDALDGRPLPELTEFAADYKLMRTFDTIGTYNDRLWDRRMVHGEVYTYHELCAMSPVEKDHDYAAPVLCLLPVA